MGGERKLLNPILEKGNKTTRWSHSDSPQAMHVHESVDIYI